MLRTIQVAVAESATAEQKVAGAQACRTIMTALEVEVGKPIVLAGVPAPSPLAGIAPDQALDLLIARLSAMVPPERSKEGATPPRNAERAPLRIAFVQAPPRGLPRQAPARRKP
jgi:hypothetical protein